jgi:hypothetical protein
MQALCNIAPTEGMNTAPSAIAVLTDSTGHKAPYNFEVEDYAAAAAQMLLATVAMGYTSVWLDSPFFGEKEQKAALEALGATDRYHLRVVLPIGLPAAEGSKREKLPFEKRVSYKKL